MDNVIVTVLFARGYDPMDFEMPASLTIDELEQKMLETVQAMDIEHFGNTKRVKFKFNNIILEPDRTLQEYGVWDGSYLSLVEIGG